MHDDLIFEGKFAYWYDPWADRWCSCSAAAGASLPPLVVDVTNTRTKRNTAYGLHWTGTSYELCDGEFSWPRLNDFLGSHQLARAAREWVNKLDEDQWRAAWRHEVTVTSFLPASQDMRLAIAQLPPHLVRLAVAVTADGWVGSGEELRIVCEALAGDVAR